MKDSIWLECTSQTTFYTAIINADKVKLVLREEPK